MAKVRPLNSDRYDISKHKFWQLYHFCLQYPEWKDELKYQTDTVKSLQVTDMPHGNMTGNPTEKLGSRRALLSSQCKLIEDTAKESDPEIWEYILKGVTNENASYNYLKQIMDIPCGKNYYYEKRRKFFFLLAGKI